MNILPDSLRFCAVDLNDTSVALPFPEEFEIVKSFDSPAHSFMGIFPCMRSYPELYQIEVWGGNTLLFRGFLDEQTITDNDHARRMTLMARSAGAVLLDNEALPQIYGSISLTTLFNNHIRPYGFNRLVADDNPSFYTYQVVKGTSEWEVFAGFVRNAFYRQPYIDENGAVVCKASNPRGENHRFSNREEQAQRYSSLKMVCNRYAPITRFVIRDNEGFYSKAYDNSETAKLRLRRRRYLIPSPEYAYVPESVTIEAALRVRHSMLSKNVITLSCHELLDFRFGDRVDLDDGFAEHAGLFVQQVRHRLSKAGMTTTLTLLEPYYV